MSTEDDTRILVIARHGAAVKREDGLSTDQLADLNAVYGGMGTTLYNALINTQHIHFISNFLNHRAALWHSDKQRTRQTGLAALGKFYGLPAPRTIEDIEGIARQLTGHTIPDGRSLLTIREESLLGYEDLLYVEPIMSKLGNTRYNRMVMHQPANNTLTTIIKGQVYSGEITTFNAMLKRGEQVIRMALDEMLTRNTAMVMLTTHDLIACAIAASSLGYNQDEPLLTFDHIGGEFKEYDLATIPMRRNTAGHWKAIYQKGNFFRREGVLEKYLDK